jgi:adenylosuccinate synthase
LLRSFPPEIEVLGQCQPEYLTLKGWNQKTAGIQNLSELPLLARDYLKRLSDLVRAEISVVSTGPDRAETIIASPHSRLESWISLYPKSISS